MKCYKIILTASALLLSTATNAALIERIGGLAYYDDQLDITWLADANFAQTSGYDSDGKMNWVDATAWVNTLVIDGISGWRLADIGVDNSGNWFDCNHELKSTCIVNEMSHLNYYGAETTKGNGINSSNNGPFSNVQSSSSYWSASENQFITSEGYIYRFFNSGGTNRQNKIFEQFSWAVYDGDINNASVVPVPAAAWLFGSGLLGLVGLARRKKA